MTAKIFAPSYEFSSLLRLLESDRSELVVHIIVIAFTLPAAVFLLEALAVGWDKSSLRRMAFRIDGSQWTDLFCFLVYGTGFFNLSVTLGTFGFAYYLTIWSRDAMSQMTAHNLCFDSGAAIVNFGVYYLVYSLLEYWMHRIFHSGMFWHFHRIHHSATSMNPLVQHRGHPMQHAIQGAIYAIPLGLIATPPIYLAALAPLNQLYQLLVHADVGWSWGWFGRWVLISPAAHRLHHSTDPEHHSHNLSVVAIWDHIFGTYYKGGKPVTALGTDGAEYNQYGPLADVLADYFRATSDLFGRICSSKIGSSLFGPRSQV